MFDALIIGLQLVVEWPSIGYLMLGALLGMWIGAVPGLGGIIGLVLLLPFAFGMEPVPAMALLLGLWTVTTTSDTIASVMLGIPGTVASQATILDGYPLAQQGQAGRAFGAAFTVSAFGGVFGAMILAFSLPIIAPLILAFRSPELFMLGMLGLTMVGTLSGSSMLKGLISAMLGLMLGFIGMAETIAQPRYHFDSLYLLDELPIIPVVLGLFALPELLELAVRNVSISRVPKDQAKGGGVMDGVRDAFKYWWLTLRCSIIGTYIGMLPGLGASIVDWVAYGHAVQSTKDNPRFGQGDIRGVIAPEAANNAIKGGALVPTVAFGIPGSLGTSILLGALVIQGIRPGRQFAHHFFLSLDDRGRQYRSCNFVVIPGQASRKDCLCTRSLDRPRSNYVCFHGRLAWWFINGRLDYLSDHGRCRLCHEARRLAQATIDLGSHPWQYSGEHIPN